jgi:hypothetical protein
MGNTVISQFFCPLVGCRFRSLRHISTHIPLPGHKGRVGRFTVYQFIASTAATIAAISASL